MSDHKIHNPVIAIVGASSGNLVEWYDFYAYSFTSLYFAAAFFPKGDATSQLLNTAGIFAVGFFMRPLGGWLFGRIADRLGRRTSMMISVLMMCFGSLMVGLLPTYASIGFWAPFLLLVARLIQGLSVGGEYGTSATYMSEVAVAGKRGFYASFQYVTLIGGQLLATLVLVVLQQFLAPDELRAWGWRIPFFIGALAALVALFLRRALVETATESSKSEKAGTIAGVLEHPRALLTVLGYTAGGSLAFYTYTTYMQKYLVNTAHMNAEVATLTMTAVLFCFMLLQPAFGALSDRIGRRNMMIAFGVITMLGTVPVMTAIGQVQSPVQAFALVMAALAGVSFYTSISGIVKAEMFPPEIRALAVGLSYAIGNAAFGGTAEYVALLFKSHGHESAFFWYVSIVCAVALGASWIMPDSRKHGYLKA
ncbi:MHS family alpha-ketoglutarate permease-like MFS transporter [Pseudoduganella flava]|uniref:Alpha-ketoglutarate permease n=1 Tax=Pseudoduganella flava TaxID=871742 RepID=A0A562PGZ4_9BURK|nr:MFS family transporter [Pseudoduganella flava]QGZ42502.1 MFS transporter [Pseudoduganella flava]TWI43648.1 MHS family alpha-ketoglutarate permease-like MFS transporter [Pseudoduganella flava]